MLLARAVEGIRGSPDSRKRSADLVAQHNFTGQSMTAVGRPRKDPRLDLVIHYVTLLESQAETLDTIGRCKLEPHNGRGDKTGTDPGLETPFCLEAPCTDSPLLACLLIARRLRISRTIRYFKRPIRLRDSDLTDCV